MRDDYPRFRTLGAEILVVTRHDAAKMRAHWTQARLPYPGIADEAGAIAARYGQQWRAHKLGRMPAQFVVDCGGRVAYAHHGASMSDIPDNARMLELVRRLLPGCGRASLDAPGRGPEPV